MKLAGSYKLNVKKEIVWSALNNAKILKKCLPGCESFEKENDTTFKIDATNQVGPMNATFSGFINLSNIFHSPWHFVFNYWHRPHKM